MWYFVFVRRASAGVPVKKLTLQCTCLAPSRCELSSCLTLDRGCGGARYLEAAAGWRRLALAPVVVMVGLQFPQMVSEGRIQERSLAKRKRAELLLLACCKTQKGTHQIGSDNVWCLSHVTAQPTASYQRLSCVSKRRHGTVAEYILGLNLKLLFRGLR